ncbi:fimbrial protein [Pseudomonas endophytica]|nr:fimbrial protein [Pseudomonas endophytica]
MKYTIGFFLLLLGTSVLASECRVNGSDWRWIPSTNILDVRVTVKATPGTRRILLDGYTFECKFSNDSGLPNTARDFWHTTMGGVRPGPKLVGYNIGLNVQGTDHDAPVSSVLIATLFNYGSPANLMTYMYVINHGSPQNPINIRYNDLLGEMLLRQTNNTGKPPVPLITLRLIANNDLVIEPSTCTINGNRPITVDFNSVDRSLIGESPLTTNIRKDVRLAYSCPDPNVTRPIKITMKGQASLFSSDVLAMSNPNLGAGLLRNGAVVKPQGSFNTNIYNSSGGDDVVFVLTRKPGTEPTTGAFSGSATLVMGLP